MKEKKGINRVTGVHDKESWLMHFFISMLNKLRRPAVALTLKFLVTLLLLIWIFKFGQFNLERIVIGLTDIMLFSFVLILYLIQLIIGAFRSNLLMQFKEAGQSQVKEIAKVTWASVFVSSCIPLSLIGDIYKVKKLIEVDRNIAKDNSVYSALYSKFFSVLALSFMAGVGWMFSSRTIPSLIPSIQIIAVFFMALLLSLLFLKPVFNFTSLMLHKAVYKLNHEFTRNRIRNFKRYNKRLFMDKRRLLNVVFFSFLLQFLKVISILLVIVEITPQEVNVVQMFAVIPVGVLAMMLPVSISGLGVGHYAFAKLLEIYGISTGVDVFTIFFAFMYIFNLMGVVPFILLTFRNKKNTMNVNEIAS